MKIIIAYDEIEPSHFDLVQVDPYLSCSHALLTLYARILMTVKHVRI